MFPIDATDHLFYLVASALSRLSPTLLAQHIRDEGERRRIVTRLGRAGKKCYWHNEGETWAAEVCLWDGTATGETLTTEVASDEVNAQVIADALHEALARLRGGGTEAQAPPPGDAGPTPGVKPTGGPRAIMTEGG